MLNLENNNASSKIKKKLHQNPPITLKRSKSSHALFISSPTHEKKKEEKENQNQKELKSPNPNQIDVFDLCLDDTELEVMELDCSQQLDELRKQYSHMLLELGVIRRKMTYTKEIRDEIRLLRGLDNDSELEIQHKMNTWGSLRAWGNHLLLRFKKYIV
jgi:mevalonate kinase